jgi:hypothetical protein
MTSDDSEQIEPNGPPEPVSAPISDAERATAEALHKAPDIEALAAEAELVSGSDNQGPPPDDELE